MGEIVMSDGTVLDVPGDPKGIIHSLGQAAAGVRMQGPEGPLPIGFIALQVDADWVYLNPQQVMLVRDASSRRGNSPH
jgi:hypothetical protein